MATSENLDSLGFSFSTTVRAIRDSLRDAAHVCSVSFRIIGSISVSKTSCSKVSSADMDCVGLSGTTSLLSIPLRQLVETHAIAAEAAFERGKSIRRRSAIVCTPKRCWSSIVSS